MLFERRSLDLEPFMHRRFPLVLIAAALAVSTGAFAQNEIERAGAKARPPIAPLMPNAQPARSDEDGPFSRETPATFVAKKTKGAVVMLRAMQSIPARLNTDEAGRTTNLGAGIIFDKRGYIVTNYHVVANVQKIDASWPDGRVRTARRVNYDSKADLAVLKLDGDDEYPVVSLSEGVQAIEGEVAIAVGNPYGLGNSLAWGIVSHVGRDMKLPNNEMGRDLIQVSAAINPGNSGGPLFNVNGQLLGITAAIRSNSQGIAFAITTKRVLEVVKNLMPSPISLETLGLAVTELSSTNSNHSSRSLVQVSHVDKDSPASKAGLAINDRIDSVDGQAVRSSFDLERAFWNRQFGDSLMLKINGKPTVGPHADQQRGGQATDSRRTRLESPRHLGARSPREPSPSHQSRIQGRTARRQCRSRQSRRQSRSAPRRRRPRRAGQRRRILDRRSRELHLHDA